ncbi:MAG: spore maturation protein [Oscillospiraceae bacterium]
MSSVGDWAIPVLLCVIVTTGFLRGVDVFDCFLQGARSGVGIALRILPALVGLITAVGIFKASGALDLLTCALAPLTERIGLPGELIPLALLRPVSGSGAMVIFNDLLATYGPDSFIGRVASVMEGSTETTFYTIAVYYGATAIRRTRHTVPASITADLVGFFMSALMVRIFFKQ